MLKVDKILLLVVTIALITALPIIILTNFPMPYGRYFRSSEFISDHFDYSFIIMDGSGEAFRSFSSEVTASLTLYSLYLGQVEFLFPIENSSEAAGKNFSIGTNIEETIRPFIKYPGNITLDNLQQGEGSCLITLPSDIEENVTLGIRQYVVLNFSDEDWQHLIRLRIHTIDRKFKVTHRIFLSPELQFIRNPESNPSPDVSVINKLGSEMVVTGEIMYIDYPLRLSDSFRQLQYYGNSLRTAISIFAISISISLATLFLNAYGLVTGARKTTGRGEDENNNKETTKQTKNTEHASKVSKLKEQRKPGEKLSEESDNQYSKRIKILIEHVEKTVTIKNSTRRVVLRRRLPRAILGLLLIVIVASALFYMWKGAYSYLRIAEAEGNVHYFITVAIATSALFMAGASLLVNVTRDIPSLIAELSKEEKEYLTNWYFSKLRDCEKKEDIPLLKALIMMKCKHPDINLVYKKDDSRFTEENLLNKLYE